MTTQSDKVKTFSLEKAREIAEDLARKFYGLEGHGRSAYMEKTIARALEEAREQALEEAAELLAQHGYAECARDIRFLKREGSGGE